MLRLLPQLKFAARVAVLLILTTCIALNAYAQDQTLHYIISRSGNPVGSLVVKESKQGNRITYNLKSAVKASFLFSIAVKTSEESIYQNSVLTYSRVFQEVNNNERVNTQIQASNAGYTITDNKKEVKKIGKDPITYNLVCLYTVEPLHVKRIFADKFQKFIPVQTLGAHHYKISFPDGGNNEYFYRDGICVKVKLNTSWFSAEMNLKK